jgi:DNA-binding NtrC family response regulator
MATICVISDHQAPNTLLADLLSDHAYDTVLSYDSSNAFEHLSREKVDLIVFDVVATGPEGRWDVLAFLHQHARMRLLSAIVCIIARDEFHSAQKWPLGRYVTFLEKPFELEDLYEVVDSVLNRAGTPLQIGLPRHSCP